MDPFQPFPYHPQAPTVESGPPSGAVNHVRGSQTFTATSFGFGSAGYASKVIPSASVATAGWEGLLFDAAADGFNMTATTPFGGAHTPCGAGNYTGAGTPWATDTDILVRKVFNATAGSITIRIAIDNDLAGVWLNGTPVAGGTVIHEGCALVNAGDNTILSATAVAGPNVLAIRGKDRGAAAYLNVKVTQP